MTQQTATKWGFRANPLFVSHRLPLAAGLFLAIASIALVTPSSLAQTSAPAPTPAPSLPANAPYVPTMTFDVASVRENKPDGSGFVTMGGSFVGNTTMLRGAWNIENWITIAYGVNWAQIVGGPKWPSMLFVIAAKSDSAADAKLASLTPDQQRAEQQHMLQALLEDRFKLKTHWETRESDIYNLVVAKGGPKLGAAGSMPISSQELKDFGDQPVVGLYQVNDGQGYDFIAHRCPIDDLVQMLTMQFGRPVTDKTGLTAQYDFVVKYKDRWDSDRAPDDPDLKPPLDRALREQLGLKVEAAKGPVKVLVIDHVEKPSEN